MHYDVIYSRGKPITYLLINRGGRSYLIFNGTRHIPYFLHYQQRLSDRHIPRVDSLTNEGHVGRDKCTPEPGLFDPLWKLFVSRSFGCGISGFQGLLDDELLIVTVRSLYQIEVFAYLTRNSLLALDRAGKRSLSFLSHDLIVVGETAVLIQVDCGCRFRINLSQLRGSGLTDYLDVASENGGGGRATCTTHNRGRGRSGSSTASLRLSCSQGRSTLRWDCRTPLFDSIRRVAVVASIKIAKGPIEKGGLIKCQQ